MLIIKLLYNIKRLVNIFISTNKVNNTKKTLLIDNKNN